MRKPFLGSAFALTFATMVGASPALAADEGKMVTGTVTEADSETGMITVDGQTYKMPQQSGTAMMPAPGDKISLFYREEGGQKVITRIGQAAQ